MYEVVWKIAFDEFVDKGRMIDFIKSLGDVQKNGTSMQFGYPPLCGKLNYPE